MRTLKELKQFLGVADNVPSGRGIAVPASSPRVANINRQIVGRPPFKTPQQGQKGDPSSSMDVMASIIMQGPFYTEEDMEWFEKYMSDPPYDVETLTRGSATESLRRYVRESIRLEMSLDSIMREYALDTDEDDGELLLGDEEPEEDEEETDEASGAGAVAGFTGPLGASAPGRKKNQPPSWKYYAQSFGNAKKIGDDFSF